MARRARGTEGAVYVEFLIVFMPLFTFFMCMVQLALLEGAGLVVQHAANRGARAAIVVSDDDPANYPGDRNPNQRKINGCNGRMSDVGGGELNAFVSGGGRNPSSRCGCVEAAVGIPLLTLAPGGEDAGSWTVSHTKVRVNDPGRGASGRGMIHVDVDYEMECYIPVARDVMNMCGRDGRIVIHRRAQLPRHGADYDYP